MSHERDTPPQSFRVRIKRQDGPDAPSYWNEFDIQYRSSLNITSVLQEIAARPVTVSGEQVRPPVWEASCLEEVCGSCSFVINGFVQQGCAALIDDLLVKGNTITIEPMSKFPVVRDLHVDRSRMFNDLERIKAWVPVDSVQDLGPGPTESPEQQELRYELSRCMTCGCCLEACPPIHDRQRLRRPVRLRPDPAVQPSRNGQRAQGPASGCDDGAGRHQPLRPGPELRESLPERCAHHHGHRPHRPADDRACGQEVLSGQVAATDDC